MYASVQYQTVMIHEANFHQSQLFLKYHTSQSENTIRVAEAFQRRIQRETTHRREIEEQQSQGNHLRAEFEEETRAGCCGCELFSSSSLCLVHAQKK